MKAAELQSGFLTKKEEGAANEFDYNFSGVDKSKSETSHYGLQYASFVVPVAKATGATGNNNRSSKRSR